MAKNILANQHQGKVVGRCSYFVKAPFTEIQSTKSGCAINVTWVPCWSGHQMLADKCFSCGYFLYLTAVSACANYMIHNRGTQTWSTSQKYSYPLNSFIVSLIPTTDFCGFTLYRKVK